MGEEVLVAVIVGMGHTVKVAWNRCRRKSIVKTVSSRQAPVVGVAEAPGRAGLSGVLPGAGSLLANAALNLADDAVFAMLDVGGGYKSWEEAGLDFGKKALTSAVNIGVGGAFNGFGGIKTGFFAQGGGLTSFVSSKVGTGTAICQQICHLFMHPFYELFSWSHWMDLSTQPAEPSTF